MSAGMGLADVRIWAEVYRDFGMSDDEIYQYFAGPAFLAYQRLGHIQGSWGGQLSQGFISELAMESRGSEKLTPIRQAMDNAETDYQTDGGTGNDAHTSSFHWVGRWRELGAKAVQVYPGRSTPVSRWTRAQHWTQLAGSTIPMSVACRNGAESQTRRLRSWTLPGTASRRYKQLF